MLRPLAGSCSTMPAPRLPALKMKYAVFTKFFSLFRYQFPLSSHCSQLHPHPHHSFHFFATSRGISPHCIVFYCAVGVVCSGLLVGCIPPPPGSFSPPLVFPQLFSAACQHLLLLFVAVCLPVVPLRLPSLCEGLRISSPRIYYIFFAHSLRHCIVKFTQLTCCLYTHAS